MTIRPGRAARPAAALEPAAEPTATSPTAHRRVASGLSLARLAVTHAMGLCLVTGLALSGPAQAARTIPSAPAVPAALLNAPARPASDRARDARRRPLALLALAHVHPGQKIADLMPGSGYFTRLLSLATGAAGHVYAVIPAEMAARHPETPRTARQIAADPAFGNVSVVVTPITDFHVAEPLDLVWTAQNYHDVYGAMGPETARRMNRAIFQALRPGGLLMIIDHSALPGSGSTAPNSLHRIDPALIVHQAESVGFRLLTRSPLLLNPADTHTLPVFDPRIRGKTDQVVLLFQRPETHGQ